jgi:hypothetical protein
MMPKPSVLAPSNVTNVPSRLNRRAKGAGRIEGAGTGQVVEVGGCVVTGARHVVEGTGHKGMGHVEGARDVTEGANKEGKENKKELKRRKKEELERLMRGKEIDHILSAIFPLIPCHVHRT